MKQLDLYNILIKPLITEKSNMLSEKFQQVTFKVLKSATKSDIKNAFEFIFKVKVASVSVLNVKGKSKKFAGSNGRRANWKKAYIMLVSGQTFDLATTQG